MAESSHRGKRRRKLNRDAKFTLGDSVEVRSFEPGFLGSWHPGTITSCKPGFRTVKYDHLLTDDGEIYFDTIEVSGVIDGCLSDPKSVGPCRIRPTPPRRELVEDDLHYGVCVDYYLDDAWWEGVVFDYDDGSDSRNIFFPDLGDLHKVNLKLLRRTWNWDGYTEEWTPREKWIFLEIIERYEVDSMIPVSVRQIWFDMRVREEFVNLEDWFVPENAPLWEEMIGKVIDEYIRLTVEHFLRAYDFSEAKLIPEAISAYLPEVVPLIEDVVHDDDLISQNQIQVIEDVEQPVALSIVPSSADPNPIVTIKRRAEARGSTSSLNWIPLEVKMGKVIEPKYWPEIVDDYCNTGHRATPEQTKKFRQHLVFLGWRLQSAMYKRQHKVRFISPEGKLYHCPRDVASLLKGKGEDSHRMIVESPGCLNSEGEKSVYSSDLQLVERVREEEDDFCALSIPSQYDPESVFNYLKSFRSMKKTKSSTSKWVYIVRMHLSSLGWKMWLTKVKGGKEEWRYKSPTSKKTYNSLKRVCKAIRDGYESNSSAKEDVPCSEADALEVLGKQGILSKRSDILRKRKDVEISKPQKKRSKQTHSLFSQDRKVAENRLTNGLICSFISKKKKVLSKVEHPPEAPHNTARVLRSTKRVRQTGLLQSSSSRTVLSWLIENDAVIPRSKVFYYKGNSSDYLAEGRITSDGVKCNCCSKLFTLSAFQAHVKGDYSCLPAENLFLDCGKSLLSCQVELMQKKVASFSKEPVVKAKKGTRTKSWNDHICSICHYGGELILCDKCPSSFHGTCLNLENTPEGDWFCPSCCCAVCGKSQFDMNTQLSDDSVVCCHQCERKYHTGCKKDRQVDPGENWFCCRTCEKMHWGLQQLLGKPVLVGQDMLTCTLVKPMKYQEEQHEDYDLAVMAENFSKISVALEVMHECFEPVKEPRTKRDLVEDVMFCRGSNLNRLNFKGFYTLLLERNDELISVALLRVFGEKVAEIPLIGTRFQHRRRGMCRVLMNEIEKNLLNLGVQKLVLPAAASVLTTWTTAFGFSPITPSDRSGFLGYTFLDFQDTTMCQKHLMKKLPPLPPLLRCISGSGGGGGDHHQQLRRITDGSKSNTVLDHEGNNSSISEVFQEDKREGSEIVDQGTQTNAEDKSIGTDNTPDAEEAALVAVTAVVSPNQEAEQPCNSNSNSNQDWKKVERLNTDNLRCYKRKKTVEPRPAPAAPLPQTSFPKLQVSC